MLGHGLQLRGLILVALLETEQLVLLQLHRLQLILQPLKHFIQSGHLLLRSLQLLFQDALPRLTLSELLPQQRIRIQLMLQVVLPQVLPLLAHQLREIR